MVDAMPEPWTLDTVQLLFTVRKKDGTSEDIAMGAKAGHLSQDGIEFTTLRLVPTWTKVADEDLTHVNDLTGEVRVIKKGEPMSYEDTPVDADCVKPALLVSDERGQP